MQHDNLTPNGVWGARSALAIVASHCCICRRPLRDATSVENGIGPVCGAKYYSDAHVPTDTQILEATGALAASNLPDGVVDSILESMDAGNVRKASNMLVFYASAHYDERDVVLDVAAIIRDFGYAVLADKLEEDRTVLSIRLELDEVQFGLSKMNSTLRVEFKKIPGLKSNLSKSGGKHRMTCPAESLRFLEAVLGFHFGGQLAAVHPGVFGADCYRIQPVPRKRYGEMMSFMRPAPGPAAPASNKGGAVRIRPITGGRFEFWGPYSASWLDDMKRKVPNWRDRKWTGSCWVFEGTVKAAVKDLAARHYGVML